MKTINCILSILISFLTVTGQPYWLLDGYEFTDVSFIRKTFVEPNQNKFTFIINSRAYVGAGVNLLDINEINSISKNKTEILSLKNSCYIDYSKMIEKFPTAMKSILPSGFEVAFSAERQIRMEDKYRDSTNIEVYSHTQPVELYSITPTIWLYWGWPGSIINNFRTGIQNECNLPDTLKWSPFIFADIYIGESTTTRNLFRFGFNTKMTDTIYSDTVFEEEIYYKKELNNIQMAHEFQHDFRNNLSISAGLKLIYSRIYQKVVIKSIEPDEDEINVSLKIHTLYMIPHFSLDYTFPTFLNTISFSIFAPVFKYNKDIIKLDFSINSDTDDWKKLLSASVYITMPFWSKPLNVKTSD